MLSFYWEAQVNICNHKARTGKCGYVLAAVGNRNVVLDGKKVNKSFQNDPAPLRTRRAALPLSISDYGRWLMWNGRLHQSNLRMVRVSPCGAFILFKPRRWNYPDEPVHQIDFLHRIDFQGAAVWSGIQ